MHRALEVRNVKGTTSALCELDSSQAVITVDQVTGFNSYHNFCYQFGIGPGELIKWDALNIKCESLIIAKDSGSGKGFSSVTPRPMTLPTLQEEADVDDEASYQCNKLGCSYVSGNLEAVQDHLNFGNQGLSSKENEGIYDKLRRAWAHKFAALSIEPVNRT